MEKKGRRFRIDFTIILIVLLCIPLIVISLVINDNENDTEIDWVVGHYICGEGFDDKLVDDDISDTLGLSRENMVFYYLVDYKGPRNTHFFQADNYTRKYLNISLFLPYDSDELDLGSQMVLENFVEYLYRHESSHYCLILWGHGRGYDGICFDGESRLTPQEINGSLSRFSPDLLILDGCEMICAEFLYEIRGCAGLVLGTEKDLPDRGLDYFGGFTTFLEKKDDSASALATCIMDATYDFYTRHPSKFSLQLSLIDMASFSQFTSDLIDTNHFNVDILPGCFESGIRFDLGKYLQMNGYDDLFQGLNGVVLHQVLLPVVGGKSVNDVSGISILSPEKLDSSNEITFLSYLTGWGVYKRPGKN